MEVNCLTEIFLGFAVFVFIVFFFSVSFGGFGHFCLLFSILIFLIWLLAMAYV